MAGVRQINEEAFRQLMQQPGVVVVDFWATWCMPCKMTAPLLEQLAEHFDSKLTVAKVDVDEEPRLADEFGIDSIPYIAFFKDGKLSDALVGLRPYEELENTSADLLK